MSSIRSQIMGHINTVLNATGAPCTFFRSRKDEFQLNELPAGNFFPMPEPDPQIDAKEVDRQLIVNIACLVATAQDPVDDAVDQLYVWVIKQIMSDQTLGGLCVFIEEKGSGWNIEQKGAEQCGLIVPLIIHYRTPLDDPTVNVS